MDELAHKAAEDRVLMHFVIGAFTDDAGDLTLRFTGKMRHEAELRKDGVLIGMRLGQNSMHPVYLLNSESTYRFALWDLLDRHGKSHAEFPLQLLNQISLSAATI